MVFYISTLKCVISSTTQIRLKNPYYYEIYAVIEQERTCTPWNLKMTQTVSNHNHLSKSKGEKMTI